jgi:arylsulfatase A
MNPITSILEPKPSTRSPQFRYLRFPGMKQCILAILFLMPLAQPYAAEAAKPASSKPNIIIFLLDDQSWVGTSVPMDPRDMASTKSDFFETPALAKLATEGMAFVSGYASAAMCTPSRYAIEFGQTAARLRVTQNGFVNYRGGSVGIGQMLREQRPEYISTHFGKWGVAKHHPTAMGYASGESQGNPSGHMDPKTGKMLPPDNPKRTPEITKKGLDFLDQRAKDKRPFFLYLSFFAVHQPCQATLATIAKYQAKRPGIKHNNIEYAAMTEEADRALAQIRNKLHELGMDKNTYFIYTSDNGGEATMEFETLNQPLKSEKNREWEGGIRVPFIVQGPGIKPGTVSLEPVIGYDLLPTIAEIAGIQPPPNLDGGSLLPILHNGGFGKVQRPNCPGLVWHMPFHHSNLHHVVQDAIREGKYKYIRDWNEDAGHLFNVDTDFREQYDLSAQMPELAKRLESDLTNYLAKVDAEKPQPDPAHLNAEPVLKQRNAAIRSFNNFDRKKTGP